MTRIRTFFGIVIFFLTVTVGNFYLYEFFTEPGEGFSFQTLAARHIIDLDSLLLAGFFPLFFNFRIFSGYMILLLCLLIYSPTKLITKKSSPLFKVLVLNLLIISIYSSLNYRYHITLLPLILYFIAIGIAAQSKPIPRLSIYLILLILSLINIKNHFPIIKAFYRENIESRLGGKDIDNHSTCNLILSSKEYQNLTVITYEATEIESFCRFSYKRLEPFILTYEYKLNDFAAQLPNPNQFLLLVGKRKKSVKLPVDYNKFKSLLDNSAYSLFLVTSK